MNYSTSPAWSIKAKYSDPKIFHTPSPYAYHPKPQKTFTQSPTCKIGKQSRSHEKPITSPGPSSYFLKAPQKIKKFGIIGRQSRQKQSPTGSPGPGQYEIEAIKESPNLSMSMKFDIKSKTLDFPGPSSYNPLKFQKEESTIIGTNKRFIQKFESYYVPGPGSYNLQKRPSSANHSFSKAKRHCGSVIQKTDQPGPGKYSQKGLCQENMIFQKGYSLGIKNQRTETEESPGPGNYSPSRIDLKKQPSVSMSMKFKQKSIDQSPPSTKYSPKYGLSYCITEAHSISKAERKPLFDDCKIPGPGAYLSSNFVNDSPQFSLGVSRKIQYKQNIPGPGTYNPRKDLVQKRPSSAKIGKSQRSYKLLTEGSIPAVGEYNLETKLIKKVSPKYAFGKSSKLQMQLDSNPGPGSYDIKSTIGYTASSALK